jgi:hypothetical protein
MTDLTSGQVDYEVNSKVGGKLRRGDEGQGLSTCIRITTGWSNSG